MDEPMNRVSSRRIDELGDSCLETNTGMDWGLDGTPQIQPISRACEEGWGAGQHPSPDGEHSQASLPLFAA